VAVKLPYDVKWEEEARIMQTAREWRAWIQVECSQVDDGPRELSIALPKFAPYSKHPKDGAALVNLFYPKRKTAGSNWWDIEVTWSTDVDVTGNPLAMPAEWTLDTEMREIPAIFDANGNALLNTAGALMTDPPATRKIVDETLHFTKNVSLRLPDWVRTHPGCVNSDSVTIRSQAYPPGTLWFASRQVGREENVPGATDSISTLRGTPFTAVSGTLMYRQDGWIEYYPNRGWYQLVPVNKSLKTAKGAEIQGGKRTLQQMRAQFRKSADYQVWPCLYANFGDKPQEPSFLDSNGQMIQQPTFDNIILLAYDGYKKAAFNDLPLR